MNNKIKKIIPYFFVLIILVGFFVPTVKVQAEDITGECIVTSTNNVITNKSPSIIKSVCLSLRDSMTGTVTWQEKEKDAETIFDSKTQNADTTKKEPSGDTLKDNLTSCGITKADACIVLVLYYLLYAIPSLLVTVAGTLMNAVINMALSDLIYSMSFVSETWAIVRDVSNIFFILILIYVAVEMILGLSHDAKKMITNVIIMALLINFSMFFTKVVIDSSNILALVFYNKVTVTSSSGGTKRAYGPLMDPNEKDFTGGMFSKFNPGQILSQDFFNAIKNGGLTAKIENMSGVGFGAYVATGAGLGALSTAWSGPGALVGAGVGAAVGALTYVTSSLLGSGDVPAPLMAGIIVMSGAIMIMTTYAFFVAAISFIGRMCELWVLIIFSPFAFMSFALPKFSKTPYIGWEAWTEKLFATSFMAPIFMFFMYFIFKVINSNLWIELARPGDKSPIEIMLLTLLPAILVILLLLKAVSFAKKGGGVVGDMLMKGVNLAAGLAVGGGLGLTAKALQGTVGHLGKMGAESETAEKWANSKNRFARMAGRSVQSAGMKAASSSFDARSGVLGAGLKMVSSATGMKINSGLVPVEAGGYVADVKRRKNERDERAETLREASSARAKGELKNLEVGKHEVENKNSHAIEKKDKEIEDATENEALLKKRADTARKANAPNAAEAQEAYSDAVEKTQKLKDEKSAIKKGALADHDGNYGTHNNNISELGWKNANQNFTNAEAAANLAKVAQTEAETAQQLALTAKTEAEGEVNEIKKQLKLNPNSASLKEEEIAATKKLQEATETEQKTKSTLERANSSVSASVTNLASASEKAINANKAKEKADASGGFGTSQKEYEEKIQTANHKVHSAEHHSAEGYASSLYNEDSTWDKVKFWNRGERKAQAQNVRMGVKPEKKQKEDHGHGLVDHALVEGLEHVLTPSPAAAPTGGGGHAAPAATGH